MPDEGVFVSDSTRRLPGGRGPPRRARRWFRRPRPRQAARPPQATELTDSAAEPKLESRRGPGPPTFPESVSVGGRGVNVATLTGRLGDSFRINASRLRVRLPLVPGPGPGPGLGAH
jgi:hypothetical protein